MDPEISGPWERAEYVAFENRFRGSSENVRERLSLYVPYFDNLAPVVELGCGRGEFLELLRESHIDARGIDNDQEMLGVCMERGLEVEQADIITYVHEMGADSTGGIFAAQVIEHLDPTDLRRLLTASYRALRKGGRLVVETVNPRSLTALVESFYRDLTHQKPLHPETLDFLLRASGFPDVEIEYTSPIRERAKLLTITAEDDAGRTLNENFRKLNGFLFGDLDYAAIATK
jgi:O-antigen chain-terminating methyltransferase